MNQETNPRDPYASAPAPKSKAGPMMRVGIVAVLLGAAVWGFTSAPRGPGLTPEAAEVPAQQQMAEAPMTYETSGAELPEDTSATTPAPAPAQRAPVAPRVEAPAPVAEDPLPAPTTTTLPPSGE